MASNLENPTSDPLQEFVTGYPKLAAQMEVLPEIGIFRRFGALNARSLLYKQAELVRLEAELKKAEAADKESADGMRNKYSIDWFWLKESAHSRDPIAAAQIQLVEEIGPKLKEYSMTSPKPYFS